MNVAALGFGYAGFDHFEEALERTGFYTSNLGDNAQTIAARKLFERLGFPASRIGTVDRDTLPAYSGPPTALLMNGVFLTWTLPAPPHITPIFLGFMAHEDVIVMHLDWLGGHAPIGCRDPTTAEIFMRHGVEAFVSGCVTLTLQPRTETPPHEKLLVVYGSGAGDLPATVLKHIPHHLLDVAEFIPHRLQEHEYPLSSAKQAFNERYEAHLLDRYRNEASVVLTPLLHVASPCLAMRVPVVLCRKDRDSRFGQISEHLTLHMPDDVGQIDWRGAAPDIEPIARAYTERVRARLGWQTGS
ncbi:hypothetical protein BH10PSE1_BH10PSE1_11220 [soil metagenome]